MRVQLKSILAVLAGAVLAGATTCAQAQWLNYPAPGTPRLPDGKPNLSAKTPRASRGKPDLSGVWQTALAPPGENQRIFGNSVSDFAVPGDDPRTFSKYFLNILTDFKPDESPMRPEAAALFERNTQRRGTDSPPARCLPQGLPRADIFSYAPFKIIQTPGVIVVLYEVDNTHRQIYTDGRKLPPILSRLGEGTRSALGTETRWWWIQPASTTAAGWIPWGIPTAKTCKFTSGSTAGISAIWIWR